MRGLELLGLLVCAEIPMRLIGLMLVRNEEWVIRASLLKALQWCDHVYVLLHACTDWTLPYIKEIEMKEGQITYEEVPDSGKWDEMDLRQRTLERGRELGGTHFAMIDADEILTANITMPVRRWVENLRPGEVLDLPMACPHRGLDEYRHDQSVWCNRNDFSVAFADSPDLSWKPRDHGYQHHARCPNGVNIRIRPLSSLSHGGVFHLQWADFNRLQWKHRHYKMMELIRWPDREGVAEIDRKYSQALDERGLGTAPIPAEWWDRAIKDKIKLGVEPWYKAECDKLLAKHGTEYFKGLNLWGYP